MSVTRRVTSRVTSPVVSRVTDTRRRRGGDADALAYITAVEAADAATLEDGVKAAYIDFVIGCKADGIWDAIKASCILAGARTLAGCLVPLVGTAPTNNGPFVTGDYNRITGLVGNGSTKYLDSNRNNNADPQNDNHNAVYASEIGTANIMLGPTSLTTGINSLSGGASRSRNETPDLFTASVGFNATTRSGAANYIRRNGGANTVLTQSSQSPDGGNVVLLKFATITPGDSRLSFYSIGESLNLENLDTRVTRLLCEIEFGINTGLAGTGYDLDTLKYVNAGYAAGGTLA